MKARNIAITLATLVMIVVGTVAVSQTARRHHGDDMFGDRALAFFTHRLDLTDAQQAQAKEIIAREKPTIQPLVQQLVQSRKQLRQFEESGNFDEAQVRNIANQQSQTLTELTVQKVRIKAELVKILTPEQKAKLAQMADRREKRMQRFTQQQPPATNQ